MNTKLLKIAATGTLVVAMIGCASTDVPRDLETQARSIVKQAKSEGAQQYAPVLYRDAEKNLKLAEKNMKKEEYKNAKQDLERSIVDAEFAIAKSKSLKAEKSDEAVNNNLDSLKEEISK